MRQALGGGVEIEAGALERSSTRCTRVVTRAVAVTFNRIGNANRTLFPSPLAGGGTASKSCGYAFFHASHTSGLVARSAMNSPTFARRVVPALKMPFCSSACVVYALASASIMSLGRTAQKATCGLRPPATSSPRYLMLAMLSACGGSSQ